MRGGLTRAISRVGDLVGARAASAFAPFVLRELRVTTSSGYNLSAVLEKKVIKYFLCEKFQVGTLKNINSTYSNFKSPRCYQWFRPCLLCQSVSKSGFCLFI